MNPERKSLLSRVCNRVIGREAYRKALSAGEKRSTAVMAATLQVFAPFTKIGIDSSPYDLSAIIVAPVGFVADMAFDIGPTLGALLTRMEPSFAIPILALTIKGLYNAAAGFAAEK